MKCSEVRRLVSPYLDSELDETTQFEIARHLQACPDCARRFRAEGELEHAVARSLRRTEGDEEDVLRAALRQAMRRSAGSRTRRALAACAFLLAAGCLSVLVWKRVSGRQETVPAIVVAAARDHEKSLRVPHEPELGGDSREAIDAFLRAEIGTELGPLRLEGDWEVEGVRRCRLEDERVGLVSLRCGANPVSLFLVPAAAPVTGTPAIGAGAVAYQVGETSAVLHATANGVRLAVGNVEPRQLRELLGEP
jgi:anti-sigma factor RsiW